MDYGMMIGVNTPSTGRLPEGYTELEYIESTGTQYINSGYNIQSGDTIELLGQFTEHFHDNTFFEVTTNSTTRCLLSSEEANGKVIFNAGSGAYVVTSNTYGIGVDIDVTINSKFVINGINMGSVTVKTQSKPVYLFAGNDVGTVARYGKVRIKKYKITSSSGVVKLDYVPAIRHSDGEVGLYDLVNGVMYGNAGTGEFIAGPKLGVDVAREVEQIFVGVNSAVPDRTYLYNSGDECSDITGGWKTGWKRGSASVVKNTDNITFRISSSGDQSATLYTTNKIDITNYKSLVAEVVATSSVPADGHCALAILSTAPSSSFTQTKWATCDNFTGQLICDISEYSGEQYVSVSVDGWTSSKTTTFVVTKVWLESDTTHMADVAREVTEGWCEVDLVARKFFGGSDYDIKLYQTADYTNGTGTMSYALTDSEISITGKTTSYATDNNNRCLFGIYNVKNGDIVVINYTSGVTVSGYVTGLNHYVKFFDNNTYDYKFTGTSSYSETQTKTFTVDGNIFVFGIDWGTYPYPATHTFTVHSITVNGTQIFPKA